MQMNHALKMITVCIKFMHNYNVYFIQSSIMKCHVHENTTLYNGLSESTEMAQIILQHHPSEVYVTATQTTHSKQDDDPLCCYIISKQILSCKFGTFFDPKVIINVSLVLMWGRFCFLNVAAVKASSTKQVPCSIYLSILLRFYVQSDRGRSISLKPIRPNLKLSISVCVSLTPVSGHTWINCSVESTPHNSRHITV